MNILQYIGQGTVHFDNGTPCQDYAGSYVTANGRVILAVSDGCSSSLGAQAASACNVRAVIEFFSQEDRALSDGVDMKKELLSFINRKLLETAREMQYIDSAEFAATLIFAVLDKDVLLSGHIGDGNLLCFDENGELMHYSDAENGVSSRYTYFTNSNGALSHFRSELVPRVDTENNRTMRNVVLYSDGPQKMFFENGNQDIVTGVGAMVERLHAGEITESADLRRYLHESFRRAMYLIGDDWSVIVLDTIQPESHDAMTVPDVMKLHFLEMYLESAPDAAAYILPELEQTRERLSDSLPDSAGENDEIPVENTQSPIVSAGAPIIKNEEKSYHEPESITETKELSGLSHTQEKEPLRLSDSQPLAGEDAALTEKKDFSAFARPSDGRISQSENPMVEAKDQIRQGDLFEHPNADAPIVGYSDPIRMAEVNLELTNEEEETEEQQEENRKKRKGLLARLFSGRTKRKQKKENNEQRKTEE